MASFGSAQEPVSKSIVIVSIDSKTQKELGAFPIDRKYYADIVNEILKFSPAAIVLKMFLDRPSTSDGLLIKALKGKNTYTQASLGNGENLISPNLQVASAFKGVGYVDGILNARGEVKGFYLVRSVKNTPYLSLPLILTKDVLGLPIKISSKSILLGSHIFPHEIANPKTITFRHYSFVDVLKNRISLNLFKNKIVLIFPEGLNTTLENKTTISSGEYIGMIIEYLITETSK